MPDRVRAGECVPILHVQMDSPAALRPNGIYQNGEGSRDHVLSGVATGTEDVRLEDRLKRDVMHSQNIQRTVNWKKG